MRRPDPCRHRRRRRFRARRMARRAAAAGLLVAGVLASGTAGAQTDAGPDEAGPDGGIDVVQVDGLLDPANSALVRDTISAAEQRGSTLLVLQLDGSGALDVDTDALVEAVADADVPIGVWVGPPGASARGASAMLALAAPVVAIAPGAGIGPAHPVRFDDPGATTSAAVEARLADLQAARGRSTRAVEQVVSERVSSGAAHDAGLVDGRAPTVGDFIVELDGTEIETARGPVTVDTADVVGEGADRRRRPNQEVRFHKLDLAQQLAHTLVTPWVAYLLLVVGLALMIFEFFTAGVGIAAAVGAAAFVGACFGFSHLPVAWWAAGLVAFGLFGLSIDLQAGGLGPWTFIGGAALVAGSWWLYDGAAALDPPWWVLVLVCVSAIVFMLSGMTAMVRARFSTPTIGREDLVGEMGVAEVDVAPDGVVRLREALWRARTNRATPVRAGDAIRVVAVTGVVLEVEPEHGGARDHRDRGRRRS